MGSISRSQLTDYALFVIEKYGKSFAETIINWGRSNFRHYPWRKNRNPYKVFICEIFLQRTKADQVVPVYNEFMKSFPNLEQLIKTENRESIIISIIKPLGLLKRAQILSDSITSIHDNFGGQIPDNYKDLMELKGIGAYIASSTLCFGFDKKKAILDANIARIYSRLFNINSRTKTPKSDVFLWNFCEKILPTKFVAFNYAMLDLGGIICRHRNPKCLECPLIDSCLYFNNKIDLE